MFNHILIFSTFIFFLNRKFNNLEFLHMPPFEKYCGYKPSIEKLMNSTNNMKLCIDGYYPHSIIVTKNNNNNSNSKDYCTYNVICNKKINYTPELILRL